jgi:hypothetical protein
MAYQRQQIPKVCDVCKRDFVGNSKQKYCSRECAGKKQKEQLTSLAEYRKKCPHCGELIEPRSGRRGTRGLNTAEISISEEDGKVTCGCFFLPFLAGSTGY